MTNSGFNLNLSPTCAEGGTVMPHPRRAVTVDLDTRATHLAGPQQRFASLTGAPGARAAGELIPGNSLLYQVSLQQVGSSAWPEKD